MIIIKKIKSLGCSNEWSTKSSCCYYKAEFTDPRIATIRARSAISEEDARNKLINDVKIRLEVAKRLTEVFSEFLEVMKLEGHYIDK